MLRQRYQVNSYNVSYAWCGSMVSAGYLSRLRNCYRTQDQSLYTKTNSSTVGSHLSELQLSEHVSYPNTSVIRTRQLSKHVGYPNTFSKVTPNIFGYFRRVSGLALPVVWQLKTQDAFYGQGRLRNKGESNHWVPLAYRMKRKPSNGLRRVVRILVARRVESGNVSHTVTTAYQQLSTSTATHSAYSFCHVGYHYMDTFCHASVI